MRHRLLLLFACLMLGAMMVSPAQAGHKNPPAPAPAPAPTPAPTLSQDMEDHLTDDEFECRTMGKLVQNIIEHRNVGTPLTSVRAWYRDLGVKLLEEPQRALFLRHILKTADAIYTNPQEWRDNAQQHYELGCLIALQKKRQGTPHVGR